MIVQVHYKGELTRKNFCLHRHLNALSSCTCHLSWALLSLQIFASLRLITLPLLKASTLGDLRVVTKATHIATGSIYCFTHCQRYNFLCLFFIRYEFATTTYDLLTLTSARFFNFRLLNDSLERSMKFSFNEKHTWQQFVYVLACEGNFYRYWKIYFRQIRTSSFP